MNGILIIAHAPLASALRQVVAHVFPDRLGGVQALDVQAHDSPEQSLAQALQAVQPFGDAPLLLLTDVLGATPCNVARRLQSRREARVLAGVNLPMLWRAVSYQHETLETLVAKALQGGNQGVVEVPASPVAA